MNVGEGKPLPLGATPAAGGVQFAVFSRNATAMHLALFADSTQARPTLEIELDPARHRTGDIWHCFVPEIGPGQQYLFRAEGPYRPSEGHRFHPDFYLIDPYAKALTADTEWEISQRFSYAERTQSVGIGLAPSARRIEGGPSAAGVPKCIVVSDEFDWQGDRPLHLPLRETVIYEAHLRGLTAHASSGVNNPGTYRGLIERIPQLKELGITTLELLPVHEFDHREIRRRNPETGDRLVNYWGYSTLNFFAPKGSYAADGGAGQQVNEFKELVRELHKAGIEIVLDVVYNHTSEGNEFGPTHSFRGLDNSIYYLLEDDRRRYRNFSGTGNTLNCNHPVVSTLILDSLRYWVTEMHVDGFRFDLASILARDSSGHLMKRPPLVEAITEDPVLQGTKLIAEPWDAGGAYHVGAFPGAHWAEWNDHYRDDVRRFWRGDHGVTAPFATRLAGSSDLFLDDGRRPFHSINFVTCHDGFTLRDLVSFAHKRNQANGERNRDGMDNNHSNNYGIEGPTNDAAVNAVRLRQQKNLLATLMLSMGTPMLLAGDEIGRSQLGNNNAYCQDNEISWINYEKSGETDSLLAFTRTLIAFRRAHPVFQRIEFFTGEDRDRNRLPDISWFDRRGRPIDWARADQTLALRIDGSRKEIGAHRDDNDVFLIFHAGPSTVEANLVPPPSGKAWHRVLDTARNHPDDIIPEGEHESASGPYQCSGRSVVAFISR